MRTRPRHEALPVMTAAPPRLPRPLKLGIGGPVGSGKTALVEALCGGCATATTSP